MGTQSRTFPAERAPQVAIRTQLVRLTRDLEPGRPPKDDGDHVLLAALRQLILHAVWLAEEPRVLQEKFDRLNGLDQRPTEDGQIGAPTTGLLADTAVM
jgi:hypothetical protein